MSRIRLNTKAKKIKKVVSERESPTSSPALIDEDSDVELLEIEDSRPSSTTPQAATMKEKIEINFDDVELLEIDDDDDEEEEEEIAKQEVKEGDKEYQSEEGEEDEDAQRIDIETSQDAEDLPDPSKTALKNLKHFPIPIIIQTNNFPYLLAPIPVEAQQRLPKKYKHLISLLDEYPMPGSTIHEVIDCIKETFKNLDNPFDERDELLIKFKEFEVTLAETCVHAYEVLLSEVYEAFEGLKRFQGSDAPTCLTLLLKPQRTFVNRLDELRKLQSGDTKGKEMTDSLLDDKVSGTENLGGINVAEDDLNNPDESQHSMEQIIASPLFERETSGESTPITKNGELFNDKQEKQEGINDAAVREPRESQLLETHEKDPQLAEPEEKKLQLEDPQKEGGQVEEPDRTKPLLEEPEEEESRHEESQSVIEQDLIVEHLSTPAPMRIANDDEKDTSNGEYSTIYTEEQSEPPIPDHETPAVEKNDDKEQHDSPERVNGTKVPSEMITDEILYESNAKLHEASIKHTLDDDEGEVPESKKIRGE
jgi:hypothetical protein